MNSSTCSRLKDNRGRTPAARTTGSGAGAEACCFCPWALRGDSMAGEGQATTGPVHERGSSACENHAPREKEKMDSSARKKTGILTLESNLPDFPTPGIFLKPSSNKISLDFAYFLEQL